MIEAILAYMKAENLKNKQFEKLAGLGNGTLKGIFEKNRISELSRAKILSSLPGVEKYLPKDQAKGVIETMQAQIDRLQMLCESMASEIEYIRQEELGNKATVEDMQNDMTNIKKKVSSLS